MKTILSFLLLLLITPAAQCQPAVPWYTRSLVGMEVGPTGAQFGSDIRDVGYAARFNGRDIVRKCVEANCEYVVIWARDGEYAYYNSKIMPKCPGLGDRDVLRETVEEARKHRIPAIAYCVIQSGGAALREHPEYRMVGADGKPIERACFNSGYRDYMKRLTDEMLAYGIDGFHLDMVDQGFGAPYGCWCEYCRTRFTAEYNKAMPKGVTWDADWDRMLEFRYHTSERFEKDLYAHIHAKNPKATVDFNYHGSPPFSFEVGQRPVQHAGNSDFVTGETGIWGFSALGVSLNAEFYTASTPGQPYQVAIQRGVRMYHDQTTRPLNDMRWEMLTLLAHGAFVTMVDKTAFDGWLDPVAYQRIGQAFKEVKAKREHFGQKPVREVGLYFSSRSRDWYGKENPFRYFQSFQGAHKALVYEHIPFGVLLDENVTLERLREYPVVCLPNVTILSEREITLFRQFVETGGNLLITGQTGLYGQRGELMKQTLLADLIGAKLLRTLDSADNHVRFPKSGPNVPEEKILRGDLPEDWPFLVKGPATVYQPTTAVAIGELMQPHRTIRQKEGKEGTDWPMSAGEAVGPAFLINTLGKGKVLTIAASPDFATASDHHIVEARRLLSHAIRYLNPTPVFDIKAPANVEAVITDDPTKRLMRVHLLGYQSPPATTPAQNRPYILPGLMEDAPLYRVSFKLNRPVRNVRAYNKDTELKRSGSQIDALVKDVHDILIIRY